MRTRALVDFPFFSTKIVGREWGKFHYEQAEFIINNRFACLLSPRGHLKTSIFSIDYPLWFSLRDKMEVCLISHKLQKSQENIKQIRDIVMNNDFFKPYRPNREETSTKSEIELKNGSKIFVEPYSDRVVGIHPDLMILDDILLESELTHQQVIEIFKTCVYPTCNSPMKYSQLKVIGTPKNIGDLLFHELKKPEWGFAWKRYQAVITDSNGNWVKPLWSERTDLEYWRKERRRMGEFAFQREFMCNPIAAGKCFVKEEHIYNCLDYGLEFKPQKLDGRVFLGCDFSWGESEYADYSVFTVVQMKDRHVKNNGKREAEVKNPVIVRHITRFKNKPLSSQVDAIQYIVSTFGVNRIYADESGYGKAFVDEMINRGLPVISQKFDAQSRNSLLVNLGSLIESERLVIPAKDSPDPSLHNSNILIGELKTIKLPDKESSGFVSTGKHDDTVMSLALACSDAHATSYKPIKVGVLKTLNNISVNNRLYGKLQVLEQPAK